MNCSVIIPTCERNDMLAECLDRVAPGKQNYPSENYEVIVTDDGRASTAEAMLKEKYPWVRWVQGPRQGPAANRNNGAKAATGKWLIFTDDDCLPEAGWLASYMAIAESSPGAMEGAIKPAGNLDQEFAECPVNMSGSCFWSANIAITRELFDQVGGFDPKYTQAAHEDQDLYNRILAITPPRFVPEAIVVHPVRVIRLTTALSRIPRRSRAWAYHAFKHRELLGLKSEWAVLRDGMQYQATICVKSLRKFRFRSITLAIASMAYGVPISCLHYRSLRVGKQS